jgi:hypothetical protein
MTETSSAGRAPAKHLCTMRLGRLFLLFALILLLAKLWNAAKERQAMDAAHRPPAPTDRHP